MTFTGKYVMQSSENLEPLIKAVGAPDDVIQQYLSSSTSYDIVQNGKSFRVKLTTGSTVVLNSFIAGEEAELELMTGEKIKTVFHLEGSNRLVVNVKGVDEVTEVNGDTLTTTFKHGDITGKRIMKRV